MSEASVYHVVAFCFDGEKTAGEIAKEVRGSQKSGGYKVVAEAAVSRDMQGKTHIHEPGRGGVGAAAGGTTLGLLSLIGGPAGLLAWAVAGGVIGGIAGHYLGRSIPKEDLEALGRQLQPNTSAYLALVEDKYAETLVKDMEGYNAKVVTLTVGDELSGEIAEVVDAEITYDAPDSTTTDSATTGTEASQ